MAVQAVDGAKVDASAAEARTHDAAGLRRLLDRVQAAIDDLEAQHTAGDEPQPARLPAALATRRRLRTQVRAALDTLDQPAPPTRINLTDADAPSMNTRQGVRPAYNVQAMVAPVAQGRAGGGRLITAIAVVDDPADAAQLPPMLAQAEAVTGAAAAVTLADAGYHSGAARDRYRCPAGQWLRFTGRKRTRGTPMRLYRASGAVSGLSGLRGLYDRWAAWVRFGDRTARHPAAAAPGLDGHARGPAVGSAAPVPRRTRLRHHQRPTRGSALPLHGLANVTAEWALIATAFNLRTLWRLWWAPPTEPAGWGATPTTAGGPA